jgi:hypothetical protein
MCVGMAVYCRDEWRQATFPEKKVSMSNYFHVVFDRNVSQAQ